MDFTIQVPEGKRKGKWLQRHAPEYYKQKYLKDLIAALDCDTVVTNDIGKWHNAIMSCHSCVTENRWFLVEYHPIWQIIGIDMAIMYNDGKPIARCLVNKTTKTYTEIYGEYWYLLRAKLEYFGFTDGMIATTEQIKMATLQHKLNNIKATTAYADNVNVAMVTFVKPKYGNCQHVPERINYQTGVNDDYGHDYVFVKITIPEHWVMLPEGKEAIKIYESKQPISMFM